MVQQDDITIHSATPLYLALVLCPLSLVFSLLRYLHLKSIYSLLSAAVKDMANCEVLLDISGVSFMDGREKFLPFNIATILPAMLLSVPVVKLSQGIGPFNNLLTKYSAKLFLKRCIKVFPRGDISYQYMASLFPYGKNFHVAPDLAFLHSYRSSMVYQNIDYINQVCKEIKKSNALKIGICPSSVLYSKTKKRGLDYINLMGQVIKKLCSDGSRVVVFPNATREGSTTLRNNDLVIIDKLKKHLGPNQLNVLWIEKDVNTDDIKSIIQCCDAVMVSRFHAMIAALTLIVPVLVIGWSHKYMEVMRLFGIEEYVLDFKEENLHAWQKFDFLLTHRYEIINKIEKALPKVRLESKKQIDYVIEHHLL
jgi:polysaccharide pyruvyl transferase WcaK-like protein